ncbi:MAG TPA: hypothetical protein VN894_12625 [Polyangiaceae bacterium]|nr:hypothetical protein [Polyangiaceae bacterium]
MRGTTGSDLRAAEALVPTLEQMLAELARSPGDGDAAWIRPLADKARQVIYWYFGEAPKVTSEAGV